MNRLVIYTTLALMVGVFSFYSISSGVKKSPLGQKLEQRRLLIERLSQ